MTTSPPTTSGRLSAPIQWKEAVSYSYTDPQTGSYKGDQAFADAIRRRVFTLIILNYQEPQDHAIATTSPGTAGTASPVISRRALLAQTAPTRCGA